MFFLNRNFRCVTFFAFLHYAYALLCCSTWCSHVPISQRGELPCNGNFSLIRFTIEGTAAAVSICHRTLETSFGRIYKYRERERDENATNLRCSQTLTLMRRSFSIKTNVNFSGMWKDFISLGPKTHLSSSGSSVHIDFESSCTLSIEHCSL